MLKFRPEAGAKQQELLDRFGITYQLLPGGSGLTRLWLKDDLDPAVTLRQLRQLEAVLEWAEPNFAVKRTSLGEQALLRLRASAKARLAGRGTSPNAQATIVAVIDTGIDLAHPALKNNL